MIDTYEDEIGKYLKKKDSDVSKCRLKARHKHKYVECLFVINGRHHRGGYCELCGKIRNIMVFEVDRSTGKFGGMLSDEDILNLYGDMEKIHLDSYSEKYIPVVKQES